MRRDTGRARARNGPARARPHWLRAVTELPEGLHDPRAGTRPDPLVDYIERECLEGMDAVHELAEQARGRLARKADELALELTGRARPLPRRNPS